MSYAFRARRKARRKEIRDHVEDGERIGTFLNQCRRGTAPRLTWWKGSARLVTVDKDGKAVPRLGRPAGKNGVAPFGRRWKQYKVFRTGPRIKYAIGVLFPKLRKLAREGGTASGVLHYT